MADRDVDAEIEDAINLIIECQEKYRSTHGCYFSGAPYGLKDWGWYKPEPWITVVTQALGDDFSIHATHTDVKYEYRWQKSAEPQLERIPKEE